jgi:hypothetical protein
VGEAVGLLVWVGDGLGLGVMVAVGCGEGVAGGDGNAGAVAVAVGIGLTASAVARGVPCSTAAGAETAADWQPLTSQASHSVVKSRRSLSPFNTCSGARLP